MKEQFVEIKLKPDSLGLIEQANRIIAKYQRQGYRLTLRQLYYQFVAEGLLANKDKNYDRLGRVISDGRLAGLVDWDAIEDRTRNLAGVNHWTSPSEIMEEAQQSFRIDKWEGQPNRIEVWVEKEALVGVVERVCRSLDVKYFACRGYVSQSEMYAAAQRIHRYIGTGQDFYILHLGDHDPSGIDMTRDIRERLDLFVGAVLEVDRQALNWHQIQLYNPPPNPAKTTDSRFSDYQAKFGDESWELDALEPSVISQLIKDRVLELRDDDLWEEKVEEENTHRELLLKASGRWDEIAQMLEK